MKKTAIIVAGGSGMRFGSAVPKQFLSLQGRPVLMRTLDAFAPLVDCLIVVLPADQQEYWRQLCGQHGFDVPHRVVTGGSSRYQSVQNAIRALDTVQPGDVVAIHDGVRPLASRLLIERAFDVAHRYGSAIPVVALTDSVRMVEPDGTSRPLLRSQLRAVQTPQVFDAVTISQCYAVEESPLFTDDASVYEAAGHRVTLVEGEPTNLKITHPADLVLAEQILIHGKS